MSPGANKVYHVERWPAACAAQRWNHRDQEKRRAVVLECMRKVRGPAVTTSDPAFGPDETTALFCYLDFLAHPDSLDRAARWDDCCRDYQAFNRARQADYYERRAYGSKGSKKLRRDRFSGRQTAEGEPLDRFDPKEIRKRFVTMASRAQKKERADRQAARRDILENPAPPAMIAMPAPADVTGPDPAYVAPEDAPF